MTTEEAAELLYDVAGWVAGPMTPGRVSRLRAWFRDHPPALTPEFQAFLRLFLAREAEGRRQDWQYAWMADAARFLLRVIHVCNEAGAEEGLARLFAAANRQDEFQTLLLTIQQHMRAPDTLPEAVPLCARLLDHPARLILLPDSHAQVLDLVGNVLRAAHLFAPRPVPGLHELRVRVATASLTPPPLDPGQSALLSDLMGHALSDRGEYTGAADDLRMAAEFYERALAGTPEGVPERAERLNNVGAAHRDIHHLAAEPAELDRAIEWFEQAVALANQTLFANNLAVSLRDRFHRDREPADLDRAVEMFERLTDFAADTDHDLPRVLSDYSSTLRLRYGLRSEVADLDRAVAAGERSIALGSRGVVRVQALTELGEVLATRAVARDDEAEFRRGLATLEQARAAAEPGSRLRDLAVYKHALAHGPWHAAHETSENLAATVAVLRAALAETPASMPYRRGLLRLLLMMEPAHARRTGDPGEMTRAIARLEAYEPDGGDEPPRPAEVRVLLADLHIDRGVAGSDLADLGKGLRLAAEAADGLILARGRTERFALTRAPDDLERTLDSLAHPDVLADSRPYGWSRMVSRLLDVAGRHPTLADGQDLVGTAIGLVRGRLETPGSAGDVFAMLASHLFVRRYETGGDPEELRHATDVLENRLAGTPPEAPKSDSLLSLTGARWRERYTVSADPAHFAAAVRRFEEALAGAEQDGAFQRIATGNLGTAYRARYNVTGDLAYLDEAVAAYERALSGWEADALDRAIPLSNLANALRASYEATGDQDHIERSIDLHEQAVAAYPAGHSGLPQRLINLASAYGARFSAADSRADLDRSRELLLQALEGMPADSPMRPDALTSLASVTGLRFRFTADPANLTEAVDLGRRAVRAARPGSRSAQHAALQLARALSECHSRGDAAAGREATALFRELCAPGTFAEVRRAAAEAWSHRAARRGAWAEAAEASRTVTEVVADLAHLQVSRGLRNRVLGQNPDFGALAAYALARDGDLEAAVMAVENARAVSLSEALQLGSVDVAWLEEHDRTELARQYESAAARWRAASAAGLDRDLGDGIQAADAGGRDGAVRAARTELERVADEIRAATGRDDFLRPPSFADVVAGAPEPLVYLVATEFGGVALIVADGGVRSLDLPALTSEQAVQWARALLPDGTLNWWALVARVARELGEAVLGPLTGELDRGPVTLIRSGYLEMLPFNAAWTPAPDAPDRRRHAIDAFRIRTAPNARVLAAAVAGAERAGETGVLAVHDPRPVSAPPLRQAAVEAAGVRAHFTAGVVLAGEEAEPDAVLRLLRAHDVAHFACHGRADVLRPLDSELTLAGDRPLRLREILGPRAGAGSRPLRLVVLSACETGAVGVHVPNEVVSLAGGLLEAGAAGVIASQWPVPDLSTALLMLRFYAEWKDEGLPPVDALPAAQRWLRDTTNKEKADHFAPGAPHGLPTEAARSLWRALVRLEPEHRGFTHPVHWAGFVFTGA